MTHVKNYGLLDLLALATRAQVTPIRHTFNNSGLALVHELHSVGESYSHGGGALV